VSILILYSYDFYISDLEFMNIKLEATVEQLAQLHR